MPAIAMWAPGRRLILFVLLFQRRKNAKKNLCCEFVPFSSFLLTPKKRHDLLPHQIQISAHPPPPDSDDLSMRPAATTTTLPIPRIARKIRCVVSVSLMPNMVEALIWCADHHRSKEARSPKA